MTNYRENFIELLFAKRLRDTTAIHEASLGRIMQHAQNVPQVGFAMLTSWRQNLSKKQNLARFTALKNQIRGLGLGFNVLTGHWRECQDPGVSYEDCPEDELIDAVEPSLFVTGITLETASQLGNEYEQDAIVYAGPETKGLTSLVFKDGSTVSLGKFSPSSIAQAYSVLKGGRTFRFEYLEWPTQGRIESLMEQAYKQNPLLHVLK
jgi:hypothetical protein